MTSPEALHRWHSLTLSPADRAILDQMEEEMDDLIAETTTYVRCPHCGEKAGRIDHLFSGRFPYPWGPWSCKECGKAYRGEVLAPNSVRVEKVSDEPRRTKTLDLLMIPARDKPVYIVVANTWRDGDDHIAYFYDEHTCPTNWTDRIEAFIEDGDADPHGVATFVRSVPAPELPEGESEYDLFSLFPEAFDAGVTIDGVVAISPLKLSAVT